MTKLSTSCRLDANKVVPQTTVPAPVPTPHNKDNHTAQIWYIQHKSGTSGTSGKSGISGQPPSNPATPPANPASLPGMPPAIPANLPTNPGNPLANIPANQANDLAQAHTLLASSIQAPRPAAPQHTKICEPDLFNGSNPKKLQPFLVQLELNFRD